VAGNDEKQAPVMNNSKGLIICNRQKGHDSDILYIVTQRCDSFVFW